jgi:hypothetical protein
MSRSRRILYAVLATSFLGALTAMTPSSDPVCHSYSYCDAGCRATVQERFCWGEWQTGDCEDGCTR